MTIAEAGRNGARRRAGNLGSLTDAQVVQYDTEGYLVLPDFLTDRDLHPIRISMQEKVQEIAADLERLGKIDDDRSSADFDRRLAQLFDGLTADDFLAYGRSWRERRPGYFELMSNAKLLDALESLLGPEIFSNPVYNVRPKVPRVAAGAVPWHQDKSYWPDANSNPVITAWIPLVDATLENGCLHVIPRTQRTRVLEFHAEQVTQTGYYEIDDQHVKLLASGRAVPLPVSAGTVILFNDRLVHCSTPNNSDHVRWSVDLRYQPTDQDPMPQYGHGFLARSRRDPQAVATLEDWLAGRPEHVPAQSRGRLG